MIRIFHLALLLLLLFSSGGQTPDTGQGSRLLQEAQVLFDSARYEDALQRGQAAYAFFPTYTPRAGQCLLLLGDVFLEKGDPEAAAQQYRLALDIFTKTLGNKDTLTALAFNNLGEYFYQKKDCLQAENAFRKALNIRQSRFGEQHQSVADSYNNLGNCFVAKGEFATALFWHRKALDIRKKVLPAGHPDLAVSHNNLGNCYYLSGDAASALPHFEEALRIRRNRLGEGHPKTAQVYNNLGNCYAALGLRSLATEYFEQALAIRRRDFGQTHPVVAGTLENLGDLCFDHDDYIAALDAYREAYGIRQRLKQDLTPATAALQHKIGRCYQFEGDFDRALPLHLEALAVLRPYLGEQHPDLAGLYNNLGNCYANQRDFARARDYYRMAAQIFQQKKAGGRTELALVYNNLGLAFLENGQTETALLYFKKAENTLTVSGLALPDGVLFIKNQGLALERLGRETAALATLDKALTLDALNDPMSRAEVLSAKGMLLCRRGIRRNDTALLRQSAALLEEALRNADSLRNRLTAAASRQRWLEKQYPVIQSAVEVCFQLWQKTGEAHFLERAFALAERSKSLQLLDNLHKERAEHFAGVPDSLLEKERYWGEELNRREKNRFALLGLGKTAEARAEETGVSEARQMLAEQIRQLETTYPDYYRLKYASPAISAASIRRDLLLHEDQALVEYFMTESALFVFVITRQDFKALRLPRSVPLTEWVTAFRSSVQAYPEASGKAAAALSATYVEKAYQIYQAVFAPLSAFKLPENLIIVPDGVLNYLPFEALLCEQPIDNQKFKTHHYLLHDYRIQYGYSATQLSEIRGNSWQAPPENLLAFAPGFDKDPNGLRPLQHSREEAKGVCRLLNGELRTGPEATLAAFLDLAGQYRILLLATHGQANPSVGEYAYLAFSPPQDSQGSAFLYVRDLYQQHIPAALVVLSACETNIGENRVGEGTVSLARGFFQAGARSVVATLWSVDDAKNADLMRLFFKQLKKGARKDTALRQAKLRFLDTHSNDAAHPVYWAAAVAGGDMEAIELEAFGWWWVVGLGLVLGFLLWKFKSH